MAKITVQYWRGTTRLEGTATTYAGAMRIAERNENKWPPRFFDAEGHQLHDNGADLVYEREYDCAEEVGLEMDWEEVHGD